MSPILASAPSNTLLALVYCCIGCADPAAAQEREFNDRPAFAQDVGIVHGTTTQLNAVHEARAALDMFTFSTVADGIVTVEGQVYAANGTKMTSVNGAAQGVLLPPGRYLTPQSSTANQLYPASYTLRVRHDPSPLPLLPLNGTLQVNFVSSGRYSVRPALVRLQLPVDGAINVQVPSGTRVDLFSEELASIRDWIVVGSPLHLPAGTYYLRLPGQSSPMTLQSSFTPMPFPALSANNPVVGTLPAGGAVVHRFTLPAPTRVSLIMQPDLMSGLPSANLLLSDAKLNTILIDDEIGAQPNRLDATLPAGTYHVSVWAPRFTTGAGRFTLTYRTAAARLTLAQPSSIGPLSLLANQAESFVVNLRTPAPLGASVSFDFAPYDYMSEVALLDDRGHLLGRSHWRPQPDVLGRVVPAGIYFVVVRHQTDEARNYVLTIDGGLRQTAGSVESTGSADDWVIRIASTRQLQSPFNPLPGVLDGVLLLDPSRGIVLPPVQMPPSGQLRWGASYASGAGIFLQDVRIEPSLTRGRFGNELH
ncbi:MAG: hypothetical protein H6836_10140 [Planctomycetes bacterium]|nr:hypothetical protein [Planctomycetota bacterium]MCB9889920.1 hypothetical protein [Planctomycetota bacterium]